MTETFDPFDPDSWPDAPGCDAFEHALTLRAQSALAPQAVPVLEAHLRACEACREHATRMATVDATLATLRPDSPPPTWEQMAERLRADVRRYERRTPWTLALAAVVGVGVSVLADALFSPRGIHVSAAVLTLIIFFAIMAPSYVRGRQRVRRLLATDDVVGTYRAELERKLRVARTGLWLWPVTFALRLPDAIRRLHQELAGNHDERARLAIDAFFIVLAVTAFVISLVQSQRLRRELTGLK